MISAGTLELNTITLDLNIEGAKLYVYKYDKDNNSTQNSGEANLEGTVYRLDDENKILIGYINIREGGVGNINGLKLGKYYLTEQRPGKGYLINDKAIELEQENSGHWHIKGDCLYQLEKYDRRGLSSANMPMHSLPGRDMGEPPVDHAAGAPGA